MNNLEDSLRRFHLFVIFQHNSRPAPRWLLAPRGSVPFHNSDERYRIPFDGGLSSNVWISTETSLTRYRVLLLNLRQSLCWTRTEVKHCGVSQFVSSGRCWRRGHGKDLVVCRFFVWRHGSWWRRFWSTKQMRSGVFFCFA